MVSESITPIEIVLAEDEEPDIELVLNTIKKTKLFNHLHIVKNGIELLKFLRKEGEYENSPTPDLVILDLNMPLMGGREALSVIRDDKALSYLPVVIMTSSDNERDIFDSYRLHANCYVQKPLRKKEFEKIVENIESFWFSIVKLPKRP